jgi:hypothetical protein
MIPGAKIVFLVRNPVERMRSHYRHEVLRAREHRPFLDAIESWPSPYVERSRYFRCLEPYMASFDRERIAVIRAEDLFGADDLAWLQLLSFLGLDPIPRPDVHLNASSSKPQFTPLMRMLWDAGIRRAPVPRVFRTALRPLFIARDARSTTNLFASAEATVPVEIEKSLEDDQASLAAWLGEPDPIVRGPR